MKSIYILVFIAFTATTFAQTSKGSFLVSGNISYSHTNLHYYTTSPNSINLYNDNSFSFRPSVGYFFISRLCGGVTLPASFTSTLISSPSFTSDTKTHSRSVGVGPFVRYYLPITSKLFALGEANYSWSFYHSKSGDSYSSKYKTKQYQFSAGLSYFLNKNIGVELLGSYNKRIPSNSSPVVTGFIVSVGLQIYFSK